MKVRAAGRGTATDGAEVLQFRLTTSTGCQSLAVTAAEEEKERDFNAQSSDIRSFVFVIFRPAGVESSMRRCIVISLSH